jgi:hypothetical protein
VYLKSVRSGPARSPLQPRAVTPGMFLLSTLSFSILTVFGSSHCLALPPRQQSSEASPATISTPQPPAATAETHPPNKKAAPTQPAAASPIIVIGFLGGHVKKNNIVHREVQVAMHLRQNHSAGVYAEVFQNAHGRRAFREILRLLDVNHDGVISPEEKLRARIILYGHSWGASETVAMAWQLESDGIPVLLTVLVDRVSRIEEGDPRIPGNVAQAVNFYQLNGLLHGRPTIRAVDPASTQIIGNYQFDYKSAHVACDEFPWYARAFMGPHIEIENDPRVWNQVESLIRSKLPPENTPTTVSLVEPSH